MEKLESGCICALFVSPKDLLVDVLTKGLPRTVFQDINKLGIEDIYTTLRRSVKLCDDNMKVFKLCGCNRKVSSIQDC